MNGASGAGSEAFDGRKGTPFHICKTYNVWSLLWYRRFLIRFIMT
jgi:hypothetical protein